MNIRDTPKHLLGSLGDRLEGVRGLRCRQPGQFSATEGEGSRDEHGAEALEAVSNRTRVVPVSRPNIPSIISGYTTTVDDDSEDDEASTSQDLDHREDELDFSVPSYAKDLDRRQGDQEDSDPHADVDICSAIPERDRQSRCGDLERENREPADGVVPTYREAPRWIDEADCIREEGSVDGVHHAKLGEGLHGQEELDTDDLCA